MQDLKAQEGKEQCRGGSGEHTRPRVLFPAPSPETGVSRFWRVAFRKSIPVWQVAPAEREGALRHTRGRVCSPSNHGLARVRRFWHGLRVKKEHPYRPWWTALLAAGLAWFGCAAAKARLFLA